MNDRKVDAELLMMADIVHYDALRKRLPQAVRALMNGDEVTFGPFAITPNGIRHRDRLLAWANVSAVAVRHRDICIQQADTGRPWHCAPLSQIPDVAVFMALVNPLFVRRDHGN